MRRPIHERPYEARLAESLREYHATIAPKKKAG